MANTKPDVVVAPDGHNAYKMRPRCQATLLDCQPAWWISKGGGPRRVVDGGGGGGGGGEQRTSSAELWLIDDMHNARGLIELVTLMGASPKSRQGAWWCNWPPASKCTARGLAMVDGVAFVMRVELSLEIFASPSHHKEVHCATHLGLLGQAPHVAPTASLARHRTATWRCKPPHAMPMGSTRVCARTDVCAAGLASAPTERAVPMCMLGTPHKFR